MLDDKTREGWERQKLEFVSRAMRMRNTELISLDELDTPLGKRIVVTTVIETLGCEAIGHAFLNAGDDLCFEVGLLLSGGRATRALGEAMVRRGLERSTQLDYCRKAAREAARRIVEVVNGKPEGFDKRHHEKRLEDALNKGDVIQCYDCEGYFGAANVPTIRKLMHGPKGMRPMRVRYHVCPHCRAQNRNDHDLRELEKRVRDWTHKMELQKQAQARRKTLKAMCDVCGMRGECPGPYKDPCDEAKAILDSQSLHPQTGALEGEPGPSVPTGTDGKAVTPQGDDGPSVDLKCALCHKPLKEGDVYATTGTLFYHYPGCSKGLPISQEESDRLEELLRSRQKPATEPQGDDGWRCPSCGEWYPKETADCGDPNHIVATVGPQDWSKKDLISTGYPHPERGYGDWPEGWPKGDDGQAQTPPAGRPGWKPEWGADLAPSEEE